MIYIITFILSILFASIGTKEKRNNPFLYYALLFISIIIPALVAGYREESIGTDTSNYLGIFYRAVSCNSFAEMAALSDMEVGFQYFVFLCSRISSNPVIFFFLLQIITLIPIYKSIVESNINISFGLFIYYFLFFNMSLNISRQAVAISLILLSTTYLINGKYKQVIIYSLIAFLFHNTAIICLLLYTIYFFCQKYDIRKQAYIYILYLMLFVTFIYAVLFKTNFISIIIDQRDVYSNYVENIGESSISTSSLLLYIYLSFLNYLPTKISNNSNSRFFFISSIMSMVMVYMTVISQPFSRLGLYFTIVYVISIPYIFSKHLVRRVFRNSKYKQSYKSIFILLILYMWYFSIILRGSHETFPYKTLSF